MSEGQATFVEELPNGDMELTFDASKLPSDKATVKPMMLALVKLLKDCRDDQSIVACVDSSGKIVPFKDTERGKISLEASSHNIDFFEKLIEIYFS